MASKGNSGSNTSRTSFDGNDSYRENSLIKDDVDNDEEEENSSEAVDSCHSDTSKGEDAEQLQQISSVSHSSRSPSSSPLVARKQSLTCADVSFRVKSVTEEIHCSRTINRSSSKPSSDGTNSSHLVRRPLHTDQKSPSKRNENSSTCDSTSNVSTSKDRTYKTSSPGNMRSHTRTTGSHKIVQNKSFEKLLQENIYLRFLIILCLILVMITIIIFLTDFDDQHDNLDRKKSEPNHNLTEFLVAFDELSKSFPSQTGLFWKVLRAGTRSIMHPEPPVQPAVFIIAAPQGSENTALCIMRKYADIVTKSFKGRGTIEFSQHLRGADTPEHVKEVIDDVLSDGFSQGSRVVIIHELNRLHGESAMMFHGYCDNENAPFTRVVFVLMLHMETVDGETDDLVEKRLSDVWGNYLDRDMLLPLLSRIGNRNAFVRQENDEVLQANSC